MKKYDKYKPSDIEWLNEIPENWHSLRLKDISKSLSSGATPLSGNSKYYENGTINWLNTGDLNDGIINKTSKQLNQIVFKDYPNLKVQKKGTLVFAMYGATIGKMGILNIESTTNQACCCIELKKDYNTDFLFYQLLNNKQNIISLSVGGTQPNVSQSILGFVKIPMPSFFEQNLIANYLLIKTQTIDKKIELLLKKIDYYKEFRKSLINDAVTKGLNKNCKTENSELGFEINNNYILFRLKDLGSLYSGLSGKSGDDFNQDENENNKGYIPFTNIANNTYLKKDHLGAVVVYQNESQNKVQKGDIFFLMSSEGYEDIGKSAILDDDLEETYLNSFCKGYRVTNKKVNPYFLNYLLLSDNYRKQLTIEGKGFTRINLKMEKVNDFKVYLPNSIDEQTKIVQFLDQKTQTIDNIIVNINKQIETLKELRKTLINDVVTGKIKVVDN